MVIFAGAWAYKSSRMNLTNLSDEVEIQEFKINGEWHMRGTKAEWNEVVLPQHPDIRYSKVILFSDIFVASISSTVTHILDHFFSFHCKFHDF